MWGWMLPGHLLSAFVACCSTPKGAWGWLWLVRLKQLVPGVTQIHQHHADSLTRSWCVSVSLWGSASFKKPRCPGVSSIYYLHLVCLLVRCVTLTHLFLKLGVFFGLYMCKANIDLWAWWHLQLQDRPLPDFREKHMGEGKVKGFLLRGPLAHFIEQIRSLIRKSKLPKCKRTEVNCLIQCRIRFLREENPV